MIETLIFSKDRPAQLDLLLRSLQRNGRGLFDPITVCWDTSNEDYREGYARVEAEHAVAWFGGSVPACVEAALSGGSEWFAFMCDDDVLYAEPGDIALPPDTLSFSLRLGPNTTYCYPAGRRQNVPARRSPPHWYWPTADGDFGYPGSIDGDIYRTGTLRRMLEDVSFGNPTELEDALHAACLQRPERHLASLPRSVLCSVPVNRVSDQSQVRHGNISAAVLNEQFLHGARIDLDALDFTHVQSAHYEMDLLAAMA